jgi:hypothetical protein
MFQAVEAEVEVEGEVEAEVEVEHLDPETARV